MKRVSAAMKPFKLDEVREALSEMGIRSLMEMSGRDV